MCLLKWLMGKKVIENITKEEPMTLEEELETMIFVDEMLDDKDDV